MIATKPSFNKSLNTDAHCASFHSHGLAWGFITIYPVGPVDARTSKTDEKVLHNPQLLNRYSYSANNPYRYIDPDGRWAEDVHSGSNYNYGTSSRERQARYAESRKEYKVTM